ncbi:MAG: transposase [Chloroflexota bacterium]
MKYNPQIHHRRSVRLKGYDYTQAGAYFITICSHQRGHIFGEIVNGEMKLNSLGEIARTEWFKTSELRSYVELYGDEFVIMPNHAHGIIWLVEQVGALRRNALSNNSAKQRAEQRSAPTVKAGSLGAIVRAYKSAVTYAVNQQENSRGSVIWQRNYYEHVIRNDKELDLIAKYIGCNPLNWQLDRDNPKNIRNLPMPQTIDDYLRDAEEIIGVKTK